MNEPRESPATLSALARAVRELREETRELSEADDEPIADTLASWLASHYVAAAQATAQATAQAAGGEGLPLKNLRELCTDVVALRRGDHCAMRLKIERERLDHEIANTRQRKEEEFSAWIRRPEVREKLIPRRTREQQRKRVMAILDHVMLGTPFPEDDEIVPEEDPAIMI